MTRRRAIEIPTVLVALAIHAGWLGLTWWHVALPYWALFAGGGWLIAWHGSLQHEIIHGHPTRWARLNTLIGSAPLSLWLPYAVYRRSHLAHHRTAAITDPFDDPESRYLAGDHGRLRLWCAYSEAALLGRLTIGPCLTVMRFAIAEARRLRRHPATVVRDWVPHLIGVTLVLAWLHICGFGVTAYVLLYVYPGLALTSLRSFAEHRADADPGRRVAMVERAGPFALLFLNNNLHAAHHRAPALPWYALPAFHARHRAALVRDNGGLVYRGYGEIALRYLFRPHDRLVHPDHG